MTQNYKVTIQGPGLSMEMTEVPKAICDQITVLILTGSTGSPPAASTAPAGNGTHISVSRRAGSVSRRDANPELSLREFLDQLEPKRGPDKITAIGVYLNDHRDQDTFSGPELEQAFQSASEPVPANMPRDIKWTVKTGWIAPSLGTKGRYYVTKTGRSVAENKFPKEAVKKSRVGNGRKSGKRMPNSGTDS